MYSFPRLLQTQFVFNSLSILLVICLSPQMAGGFSYDESINGDLSGDRLNPTSLNLAVGTNSLIATMGQLPDFSLDVEYVRINLASNIRLDQIVMRSFQADFDGTGFIAVQPGTTFPFSPGQAAGNIDKILGYAHFGPDGESVVGEDILDDIGRGFGAIGFVGSLSASSYTFWIQQTGSSTNFQLDFIASAVPEPTTMLLLAWVMTAVGCARCRGRHKHSRQTV